MTGDLAGELDRLDKAATAKPWRSGMDNEIKGPGQLMVITADLGDETDYGPTAVLWLGDADAAFIVWARNHTDEIKAAFAQAGTWRQGYDQGRAVTRAEREHQRWRAEKAEAERDRLRATVQQMVEELRTGDASDGHHTHNELYEYRLLYNAHAARGWLAAGIKVVKSWKHSDGQQCFGGGWFVVVADLPTGQISNHYEAYDWDLFDVPEVDQAPEWDGHTPEDAADRLRAALNGGE